MSFRPLRRMRTTVRAMWCCVKWIMRKWPQTLSTSLPPSLMLFIGWHHRLALSYQLSRLSICSSHFVSLSHSSPLSASTLWGHSSLCVCVCVCVCVWLFTASVWGRRGGKMDGKREREEQERPDDLIFLAKKKKKKDSQSPPASPSSVFHITIWGICHFNLCCVSEVWVCVSRTHLAIRVDPHSLGSHEHTHTQTWKYDEK